MKDHTAEYEERAKGEGIPYYTRLRPLLAAFRKRQKKGQCEPPTIEDWGEFTVKIQGGRDVLVVYNPEGIGSFCVHFEFRGPISETGYRSHYAQREDIPEGMTIAQAAQKIAMSIAEEYGREDEKNRRARHAIYEYDRRQPKLLSD